MSDIQGYLLKWRREVRRREMRNKIQKYQNKIKKLAIEKDNKLLPMALEYDSNVIVEHTKKKE